MYTGPGLTIVAMLVPIIELASTCELSRHLHEVYAGHNVNVPAASAIVAYLVTIGALGIVAWLWMVWAVRRHKRWARAAATVLFVLASGLAWSASPSRSTARRFCPPTLGLLACFPVSPALPL